MEVLWDVIPVYCQEYLKVLDITGEVRNLVAKYNVEEGNVLIYNPHPTCAVTINEADPDLWEDLLSTYQKLVPLQNGYRHNAKYRGIPQEENTHAHILNTFIGQSVLVPVRSRRLLLGTWQAILYIEMDGGKRRTLQVQISKFK